MSRISFLVWILVVVVGTFMLYRVKYEVQNIRAQIVQTEHALEEEKEGLNVVAAEWAYLNRPDRLQALAAKYLSSSGMTVDQIAEIEAVPFTKSKQAENFEEEARPIPTSLVAGRSSR